MLLIIISILCFVCFMKLVGFFLGIFGRLLGVIFSIIGYILLFCVGGTFLGLSLLFLPILSIAFVVWLLKLIF